MTADQIRDQIRLAADGNLAAWAKANDISPQYVSDVLNGRREPGPKVLDALGLERCVTYSERTRRHV